MITVGTIVKLKVPCLGNHIGRVGVGFNDYGTGCQVIFANGEYDGFSIQEQAEFFEEIGVAPNVVGYKFKNVIQVSEDFRIGKFDEAFQNRVEE